MPLLTTVAACTFLALDAVVVVFQLALTAGAPWGRLTMGGKFPGRLPAGMRVVSLASAILLVGFGLTVSTAVGFTFPGGEALGRKVTWLVVAYCALGVVANAATPSRWERILWLPVVSLMLVCSLVVALG